MNLSTIPIIDNHCHAYLRANEPLDARAFRALFSEAKAPDAAHDHVPFAGYYRWALKELGRVLQCDPTEEAVLARRASYAEQDYAALLLRDAPVEAMLIDTGFGGAAFHDLDEMRFLTGCHIHWILRLEVLAQDLIAVSARWDDFVAGLDLALADLRARGVVALKSIAAYRSGLCIAPVAESAAALAFKQARAALDSAGRLRLTEKALIDFVVYRGMAAAAAQRMPVQFHTGYGDPDTDLRLGNPLHLRGLFEYPAFTAAPIVLLHESYPFTREAAYLAAVYPNAYLDISYSIPFLSYHELLACTHQALGAAPWSKILYSSDGHSIPEHGWLGAVHGRRVLGAALAEVVTAGVLTDAEAMEAASAILHANSRSLYRLRPGTDG